MKGRKKNRELNEVDHFFNMFIVEHINNEFSKWKQEQDIETDEEIETRFQAVLEVLSAEQRQVILEYCDEIFNYGAASEMFFYRLGIKDGFKLKKAISKFLKPSHK